MSEPAVKLPTRSSDYHTDTATLSHDRVNILVVDDLPEKLLSYEAILEDLGQNLVMVQSGEDALKLVLKQEFAVILLDVNMAGMDGFETASLIRQRKKSSHTPIIFLTAFTDEIRMAQGYASGAVDYLPTPVVPETLKAKVRVFIELSQMRRQAALQAEEHALRQAAEESARRSEFLAQASELFTHVQREDDILYAIPQLAVPFLGDASIFWLNDRECQKGWLAWTSTQADRNVHAQTGLSASTVFPMLENAIEQVVKHGQPQYLNRLPTAALAPVSPDNVPFLTPATASPYCTALVLPFTIRLQPCGVLILSRNNMDSPYTPADAALATDFISRASASLENVLLLHRIQEADQRKNEFLATLAHELRNPLAPIRNALFVMQKSPDQNLRQQAEETIERQLKHMVHLVDDLMDVSRITQGKIDLRKEVMSLEGAINQAVETAQTLIQQRGHTLTVDMEKSPLYLHADFSRISQIFANLLNNAAKYTDNGGHIEIISRLKDGNAVVTLRDNGIGIPTDMVSRIFDMFLQVDSSLERAQGGLGIGLTLVKNLVEMHGGTIEVQNRSPGPGSEFIVTLPTVIPPEHKAPVEEELSQAETGGTLSVLIVDDNIESAKTLGWMVEDVFGHGIHLAHSGADALEIARTLRPDVVLLDIGLPGMNGYEVCTAMRALEGLENTTFIAQTGWGQTEHRKRSKEAGFHFHLVKPVDIKELQNLMTKLAEKTPGQADDD